MWFNQNTSSTSENGVVSYLLPISGRYGNTTIFSGVRVHLKKLPLTTPSICKLASNSYAHVYRHTILSGYHDFVLLGMIYNRRTKVGSSFSPTIICSRLMEFFFFFLTKVRCKEAMYLGRYLPSSVNNRDMNPKPSQLSSLQNPTISQRVTGLSMKCFEVPYREKVEVR